MTRKQYTELFTALLAVKYLIGSPNFSYAVAINLQTIEKEIKALEAVYQGKIVHKEFEDVERAVIHSYCTKDENGEPIEQHGKFTIPKEDMEEFQTAIEDVYATFATEKAEYAAFDAKVSALLGEEIEIELLTITKSDLPKEISPAQVSGLLPIIEK